MNGSSRHFAMLCVLVPLAVLLSEFSTKESGATPFDRAVTRHIELLTKPEGKVQSMGFINPGGLWLIESPAMDWLVAQGPAVQPRILQALDDPRSRREAALVLGEIGDGDSVARLIELLPERGELDGDEGFTTDCVLRSLNRLTGERFGVHTKFYRDYAPSVRREWQEWHSANKDYLVRNHSDSGSRMIVDGEAKFARRPASEYRREFPRVHFNEIARWRNDADYERRLKAFCFTLLVDAVSDDREAKRALSELEDSRSQSILHELCRSAKDTIAAHDLIHILGEQGNPTSIPLLEAIPKSTDWADESRTYAIERIRHFIRYGDRLNGISMDRGNQFHFLRCLAEPKAVEKLIADIGDAKRDSFLSSDLEVAAHLDREPVRECLKRLTKDSSRDPAVRTKAHAALARLGELMSRDHLFHSLSDPHPGVRLAAAEGLWRLGRRDGFSTLVDLLSLRPIETGGEGVSAGNGILKVEAVRGGNIERIRTACEILGEMGDRRAIPALKSLLGENLNGVLGGGGSGSGWAGRPDVVALARMGDFSGIELLRESIRHDDRLDVLRWYRGSDYGEIGIRRFIPDLLPLLNSRKPDKRIEAAREILLLFQRGR